jgi:hypothetical protein
MIPDNLALPPDRASAQASTVRDPTVLDGILGRLRQASTVHARLAVLRELVEHFHGPIGPWDGLDKEVCDRRLPMPLLWWYRLVGRREDLLKDPGRLHELEALVPEEDGRIYFCVEISCGSSGWATNSEGEDPPVWCSIDGDPAWVAMDATLSECLIQACLEEAIVSAPYQGRARVGADTMARLAALMPPLRLAPGTWGVGRNYFHAGNGALLMATQYDRDGTVEPEFAVTIGAWTEHPLLAVRGLVSEGWERIDC